MVTLLPPGLAGTTMEDLASTIGSMDSRVSGASPHPQRLNDPRYLQQLHYQHRFPQPPMGHLPYSGSNTTGGYGDASRQPAGPHRAKVESISDLFAPSSLGLQYSAELGAISHTGKCVDSWSTHISDPSYVRVYDASAGGAYRVFNPGGLLPDEARAPQRSEALIDFPVSHGWSPNRGSSKSLPLPDHPRTPPLTHHWLRWRVRRVQPVRHWPWPVRLRLHLPLKTQICSTLRRLPLTHPRPPQTLASMLEGSSSIPMGEDVRHRR